jgi:hypothetical protein
MRRWSGQEKQRILKNLTIADLYREIEQKKSLHKKEIINCHGCQQKTNQWKFNDLEQRLCSNCQEKENQWLEPYQNEKYLAEKEKKGCYNWCANDCPQQIRPEKKSETKEMICNICRKGFNSAPNKDINHYCGERAGKLYLACDNCQKKGFETEDIKYGKS